MATQKCFRVKSVTYLNAVSARSRESWLIIQKENSGGGKKDSSGLNLLERNKSVVGRSCTASYADRESDVGKRCGGDNWSKTSAYSCGCPVDRLWQLPMPFTQQQKEGSPSSEAAVYLSEWATEPVISRRSGRTGSSPNGSFPCSVSQFQSFLLK